MRSCGLLVLFVSACDFSAPPVDFTGPPPDELAGTSPGVNNLVGFTYSDYDGLIDGAIAAGGARTGVGVIARSTAPGLGSVRSTNSAVLAVTADTGDDKRRSLSVVSGAAGSADLVAFDASGAEIDRLTFTVAPSVALDLDTDNASTSATILVGAVQKLHVTTIGADGPHDVLVGTGAVQFDLDPDLATSQASAAPFWPAYGDEVFVQAVAPGATTIVAHAPDTSVTLALTAVDASAIDTITMTQLTGWDSPAMSVSASIGSTPVYGALCSWTVPAGITISLPGATGTKADEPDPFQRGGLGDAPELVYQLTGTPGTYLVTCTIPGGLSRTALVTI
jgi:hypothetical protein